MSIRTTTSAAPGYRLWLFAAMAGAALMILGSLLPWATVRIASLTVTRQGTDGDGVQTLLMGAAALVVLALAMRRGTGRRFVLALSLLVLLLAAAGVLVVLLDFRSMAHRLAQPNLPVLPTRLLRFAVQRRIVEASAGQGVYLTMAGGAIAALASIGALIHTCVAGRAGSGVAR